MQTAGPQLGMNSAVWREGRFADEYDSDVLTPPEVVVLDRHADAHAGRVLELGCGAGRVTGHLVATGAEVVGIDLAPRMVMRCRERHPEAVVRWGDISLPESLPDGPFDVVVGAANVLDCLEIEGRDRALERCRAVLRDGGTLWFSTHNLAAASRIASPLWPPAGTRREAALRIVRIPRRLRNRRRLRDHIRHAGDHAVLNDVAHDFALLHLYVERRAQERRLAALGLPAVECLDDDGRILPPGETAPWSSHLHFICHAA